MQCYPELSRMGPLSSQGCLKEEGKRVREGEDRSRDQGVGERAEGTAQPTLKVEEGLLARACRQMQEAGKGKETFSLEPPKCSADTLILVQGGPLRTPDSCRVNVCCFTPRSVWYSLQKPYETNTASFPNSSGKASSHVCAFRGILATI